MTAAVTKRRDSRKQIVERHAVRQLLEWLRPQEVVGEVVFGDRPDAVVTLPRGRRIGIEVVEPADEGLARGEALFRKLAEDVRVTLGSETLPFLVMLRKGDGFVLDPGSKGDQYANPGRIADLIRDHARAGSQHGKYRYDALRERGIERIKEILMYPDEALTVLTSIQSRSGGGWSRERVQDAITAKNAKLPAYRAEVGDGEVWLVVAAGGQFASGTFSRCVRDQAAFESDFDRTFYVDFYDGVVLGLPTVPASR